MLLQCITADDLNHAARSQPRQVCEAEQKSRRRSAQSVCEAVRGGAPRSRGTRL